MSRIDIVLFGATGFTGKFVARELAKKFKSENFTWAIAGRSEQKLKELLNSISNEQGSDLKHVESLVVSIDNQQSVVDMCKKAKLIINCVGPYRFYGEPVIKECVKTNTHHIDVSGEPEFLEKMQLIYNEKAKNTNTYIIGSCGVDSIPADLGLAYTKKQFKGDLCYAETYLTIEPNGAKFQFNYATWVSLVHGLASVKSLSSIRKQIFKQKMPYSKFKPPEKSFYFYNDYLKKYAIPFFGSDKAVTQRTEYFNYLMFGDIPTRFYPYFTLDKRIYIYQIIFWGLIMAVLVRFRFGRELLLKNHKFFGRGLFAKGEMTPEQIKNITFKMHCFGKGWKDKLKKVNEKDMNFPESSIVTRISGPEPCYEGTARIVSNCALALLRESNKIPVKGGVITPAVAFSKTSLIERLAKDGIIFETLSQK